jgi:hypothetical protein
MAQADSVTVPSTATSSAPAVRDLEAVKKDIEELRKGVTMAQECARHVSGRRAGGKAA